MKRVFKNLFFCMLILAGLSACDVTTSFCYTFNIDNGDKVDVTLDTSDGHKISQKDGEFIVKKDDKTLLKGFFMGQTDYENFRDKALHTDGVTVKEDHPKDEEPYLRFNSDFVEDKVFFIKKVKGTSTFIGITSPLSDEEAVKAFSYLTFEKHQ